MCGEVPSLILSCIFKSPAGCLSPCCLVGSLRSSSLTHPLLFVISLPCRRRPPFCFIHRAPHWLYIKSIFDKFSATLARTSEAPSQEEEEEEEAGAAAEESNPGTPNSAVAAVTTAAAAAAASGADLGTTADSSSSSAPARVGSTPAAPGGFVGVVGGAGGGEGMAAGQAGGGEREGAPADAGRRATGKDWLQTHPHGTPPTMRLAMQFDQVGFLYVCGSSGTRRQDDARFEIVLVSFFFVRFGVHKKNKKLEIRRCGHGKQARFSSGA